MGRSFNELTLQAKAIYNADGIEIEETFEFDACEISDADDLLSEAIEQIEKVWDETDDDGNEVEFDSDNVKVEITNYGDVHSGWANEGDVWEYAETFSKFNYSTEVLNAGLEVGIAIEDVEDAYTGEFDSDEDFARDTADQLGLIDRDAKWPYNCIDWEYAAKELMYDYSEEGGHYFRIS